MPKTTIILTSFNHGKYIEEAIESVLSQTEKDFELFIWDDFSQDNSWEVIQSFNDSRIKTFRNTRSMRGIFGLNKTILDLASGKYIAIHHSDDVWESDKLEKQVNLLDRNSEVGAVFSWATPIGEDGERYTGPYHFYTDIFDQKNRNRFEWLNLFFHKGNRLCHPSAVVRRECYQTCGVYRYGLGQIPDLDMWIRICMKYEIKVLDERLIRFRIRENEANSSGSRPSVRIRSSIENYQVAKNFLDVNNLEMLKKIFPNSEAEINNSQVRDPKFHLARICLNSEPAWNKLLGFDILFGIVRNQQYSESFEYKDLIAITAKFDIFGEESWREIESLRGANEDLQMQLGAVRASNSWKVTAPFRRLKNFLKTLI